MSLEQTKIAVENHAKKNMALGKTPVHDFIFMNFEKGEIGFKLQEGPIKENGVNGCQVSDMIEIATDIIRQLNEKFPCRENAIAITKLEEALMWQEKRTQDRLLRGVEGFNQQ